LSRVYAGTGRAGLYRDTPSSRQEKRGRRQRIQRGSLFKYISQFDLCEKLIPPMILNARSGKPLPVWAARTSKINSAVDASTAYTDNTVTASQTYY
jgi:hypothetical protein